MSLRNSWLAVAAAMSCTLFGNARAADITQAAEYMQRLKIYQTIQPHGDAPFGEDINLYTGQPTFKQADVVLEGTGPAISLVRHHKGSDMSDMGDWDLSIPRIVTLTDRPLVVLGTPGENWVIGPQSDPDRHARCTRFDAPYSPRMLDSVWWNGMELITEDGSRQQVLKRAPSNTAKPAMTLAGQPVVFPAVTQRNWQIGCLSQTSNGQLGEAFLAVSPDGTRYWFDRLAGVIDDTIYEQDPGGGPLLKQPRMRATMYVTRIEDRFGNAVVYHYTDDKLTSITAADGRSVTIAWRGDARLIDRITVQPAAAQPRVWRYEYSSIVEDNSVLSAVVLPDASRWTFNFQTSGGAWTNQNEKSKCTTRSLSNGTGSQLWTMTHPSGLVGKFTLAPIWHARSYVSSYCHEPQGMQEFDPYENVPPLFGTMSLVRKELSGPGLPTRAWTYSYSPAAGSTSYDACALAGTCVDTIWMDMVDPDANRTRYTHSNRWGETEGKLLRTDHYQGASTLLRSEILTYAASNAGPYPAVLGGGMIQGSTNGIKDGTWSPVRQRDIVQQGTTFTWKANSFDSFANTANVTRSNTLGYSRTDATTYHHNTAKWVIGQAASSTCTAPAECWGLIESKTDYDANALPWKTWSFGKLQQTLAYNTDGTLKTVTDGNNHTTTFANWERGIPQKITFADTKFKSAVVDDFGQIASVTDENGYSTQYGYDAMGRLSLIDYPDADTVNWANTTRSFVQSGTAIYGLPAGHWQQTTVTGNGRQITYFDALWRPVVQATYDSASVAGTLSQTVTRYDADGRPTFVSYPQRSQDQAVYNTWANPAVNPNALGTVTAYDALGRPLTSKQNSELGLLTTTYEYLTGFQTRTTNPRGFKTSSTYLAYDQPTTDWPMHITHPEGAYTRFFRDTFGKPTALTRHNLDNSDWNTRYYAYDANQQLCKTSEVETGTTAYGYDAAGNLIWSAAALPWSPYAPCGYGPENAHVVPRRVDRTYDLRNRLSTLTFPDGLGDQEWTYTPDGLPDTVTAYNASGHTAPVVTAYQYNKRRLLGGQGETLTQPGWYSWGIGYGYNTNGHLASHAYPSGLTVTYAPNALGQPTQVGSYATGVGYHPNGAIKQFTYGNGIVHTLTQNARQLPDTSCDFTGSCGAAAVLNDGYDYDGNGNVAAISDGRTLNRGNRTMSYDGLDRLKTAVSPMFGDAAYAYNTLDDMTRVTIGGTAARDHYYCYDAHFQLTNVKTGSCAGTSVIGLGYDERGNLANKNGATYTFDYGNRLRGVAHAGTYVETYRYDGLGRRALSWSPTLGNLFSQYSQSGQLMYQNNARIQKAYEYLYLGGSLVATRERDEATNTYAAQYQHTDALGSPVAVTDANRIVVEKSEYEPYGKLINRPLKDGPGYTGHVADAATGMIYMQQRYYDDDLGKFPTVDPVTATSVGGNFNRYWYANNNPYRFVDPDGRDCESKDGKTKCTPTGEKGKGLPTVTFPTPKGWPSKMSAQTNPIRHHQYRYSTPIGNKSAGSVSQSTVNDPTPNDKDRPATPNGTPNDATPSTGFRNIVGSAVNNDVQSYSATDQKGQTWEINVTEPSHTLSPGYVLRGVVGNQLVSYGEGLGRKQAFGPISDFLINDVWIDQNQQNVDGAK